MTPSSESVRVAEAIRVMLLERRVVSVEAFDRHVPVVLAELGVEETLEAQKIVDLYRLALSLLPRPGALTP